MLPVWNIIIELLRRLPKTYIPIIVEHLTNLGKNKKESYEDSSLVKEIREYDKLWN